MQTKLIDGTKERIFNQSRPVSQIAYEMGDKSPISSPGYSSRKWRFELILVR
ncbi:hypothetical protein FAES_4218 [Fibrella aestuarina BUZ 2]|uniref:Uncharacterized protein n=1 Tax=Fibrella aestuarina BUZ 2 TaxID=1166018 RepID=I0KDL5_9BACT|nr:hypothetical protein [Fibrella aestuarina]CCH02218.1 hypothetical protein FAES_4218 [Fibrella aestuarina BUZ 2]